MRRTSPPITVAAQRARDRGGRATDGQGTDGVYDSDLEDELNAVRFDDLTYDEYLARDLKVADATSIAWPGQRLVHDLLRPGCRRQHPARVVQGEKIGTTVHARGPSQPKGAVMIPDIVKDAEHKMKSAVEHAREEFAAIRTGRGPPGHVQQVDGGLLRFAHPVVTGHLSVPEARTVLITSPFGLGSR